MSKTVIAAAAIFTFSMAIGFIVAQEPDEPQTQTAAATARTGMKMKSPPSVSTEGGIKPGKIAPFVYKGIDWLISAQHEDGGWGGGSHSAQQIRDPHKVPSDPATTSFSALALMRAGNTPESGPHKDAIRNALEFLVSSVEEAPDDGPKITNLTGTQPQSKLGGLIDTTMTTQCLGRVLKDLSKGDELYPRIDKALDKCIAKLQKAQKSDGSWNVGGGWAPVLQSSSGQTALEVAQAAGKTVSRKALADAREYQSEQVDVGGKVKPSATSGAGVDLYSFSSSQRGNSIEARRAQQLVKDAKKQGIIKQDAEVSKKTLEEIGVNKEEAEKLDQAVKRNDKQIQRLNDDRLLKGFGNNGGEEFVSFLLTSESMIIAGGEEWHAWNDKMHGLLKKIQNPDGSWSGHHCITNSTFCTAAVIQCLLADRDADLLIEIAERNGKVSPQSDSGEKATKEPPAKSDK